MLATAKMRLTLPGFPFVVPVEQRSSGARPRVIDTRNLNRESRMRKKRKRILSRDSPVTHECSRLIAIARAPLSMSTNAGVSVRARVG